MRMDRGVMSALTYRVKNAGGVIHLTAKGGLCAHLGPDELKGDCLVPSPGANQDDADWLIALVGSLWPEGMPECPRSKAGEIEA